MGLADDVVAVRRNVSRIALDHRDRPPGASRGDLLARAEAVEREARRLRQPPLIAIALLQRAELLLGEGLPREAIGVLEQVGPALEGVRQDDLRVRALAQLAQAHASFCDWRTVSAFCDEGITLVEQYRYNLTSPYLASAYLSSRLPLYSLGVRAAYELGRYEQMIERAELSKCRLILHRDGADARAQVADRTGEFVDLSRRISEYPPGQAPEALLTRRRMLGDLIALQGSKTRPEPFSLPAVRARLRRDEAILFYYWVDRHTLAIAAIDSDGFGAELRRITGDERQMLERYASHALDSTRPVHGAFDPVRRFGSVLLPATAPVAWDTKTRLLISPHRVLHSVPFHAMRYADRWLIERAAISYIPNLSSLQLSYQPLQSRRVLVVGVERFGVPGRTLAALPDAEREAREVTASYARHGVPATPLVGPQATVDRLRAPTLGSYSCLHFATHGENVNIDNPMESHFYLQNSMLDGLELATLELRADLVVLSACSSGQRPIAGRGLPELPGDDLFGLQAAFFRAGAHRVLATLWPVGSVAARRIMTGFHARLAADDAADPETALQQAICDYLKQATLATRKIYFWAPFFLSVLGRART
jgi:hypothetical protein